MRFSVSSGHLSASSSGRRAEAYACLRRSGSEIFFGARFIWSRGMLLVRALNWVKSGVSEKHAVIGVAVASIWFMGGRPSINSIERKRLVWLYWVLTPAAPRGLCEAP